MSVTWGQMREVSIIEAVLANILKGAILLGVLVGMGHCKTAFPPRNLRRVHCVTLPYFDHVLGRTMGTWTTCHVEKEAVMNTPIFCAECKGHDLQPHGEVLQCHDCGHVVEQLNPADILTHKSKDLSTPKKGSVMLLSAVRYLAAIL